MTEKQVVYTTTPLGTALLAFLMVSIVLIGTGAIAGLQGVLAGGLALFGAVFTVAIVASSSGKGRENRANRE